jgi:ABC-type sugar transport system permease subunit
LPTDARTSGSETPRRSLATGKRRRSLGRAAAPYFFISPFYFLYAAFMVVPIGAALYLSCTTWAGFGDPIWVGLENYRTLLDDDVFLASVKNTVIYVLISVGMVVPLALVIATALNVRGVRGRDLFRLIYFLPVVLSPIVITLVFGLAFDRQFGVINGVLHSVFGIAEIDWLGEPMLAKVVVAFLVIWRWTGFLTIFFLAGLQNIPRELYEAAAIDGAKALSQFRHVTLPMLRPVTVFVAVTVMVGSAQIFDEPYLLTRGGPGDATISVAMFIYREAFQRQSLGYAAAAGVLLFVAVFAVGRIITGVLGVGRER